MTLFLLSDQQRFLGRSSCGSAACSGCPWNVCINTMPLRKADADTVFLWQHIGTSTTNSAQGQ